MTFFHFGNCVALAYAPYYIVYKTSGLAEYSAFWKCLQASGVYLFTQMCKMLLLATFFPASVESNSGSFDAFGEFLKTTVDVADLIGLYLIMTSGRLAGKGQLKFMVAALGWASAELVMTRNFALWVGARGVEFDWKYIQMSFDSNVALVHHICVAMLVWLYSRSDLPKSLVPIVLTLLALSVYRPLIVEILVHALRVGSWTLLVAKAMFTACVGIISLKIYLSMQTPTASSQNSHTM